MNETRERGTAPERVVRLRKALRGEDPAAVVAMLRELLATSADPENVAAVPALLRALADDRAPERDLVDTLRALGLRRVAAVVRDHMPELVAAARARVEPPDEDELDELPALD